MNNIPENEIIPYHISKPFGENVLVIAPHPDDETLGCGGTLKLLISQNKDTYVLFLTSGDKADPTHPLSSASSHITEYSVMREKESCQAIKTLGLDLCDFLKFPDRGVAKAHNEIIKYISEKYIFSIDTVYAPSPIELNPDHRAAAYIALELQQRHDISLLFYEVSTPIRPNLLVDITSVIGVKQDAIKKYVSQLGIIDYLDFSLALNRFRALTLGKDVAYAEAFLLLEKSGDQELLSNWFDYSLLVNNTMS